MYIVNIYTIHTYSIIFMIDDDDDDDVDYMMKNIEIKILKKLSNVFI